MQVVLSAYTNTRRSHCIKFYSMVLCKSPVLSGVMSTLYVVVKTSRGYHGYRYVLYIRQSMVVYFEEYCLPSNYGQHTNYDHPKFLKVYVQLVTMRTRYC